MKKTILRICFVLFTSFMLISCNGSNGYEARHQPNSLKAVDKKTLVTMVNQLYRALNVKNFSAEKRLNVIRPYLSKYKVCLPGFSKTVPYNESFLYVYCIYDTVETPPRVLSFRFQLPKPLQQQLTINDLKKSFKKWQPENFNIDPNSTKSSSYNAGAANLTIRVTQKRLPNQADSLITDVTVYH